MNCSARIFIVLLGSNALLPALPAFGSEAPAVAAPATQQYISDKLSVGLRAGAAKEQKIINLLSAGEAVDVLDRAPGTGFLRVRARSGQEGWVEADKVVSVPPALTRYNDLAARYDELTRELDDLKASAPERDQLQQRTESLQQQVLNLENQSEKLMQQNALLERRFQSEVMYSGAAIILAGMLLGWILSSWKNRRPSAWR